MICVPRIACKTDFFFLCFSGEHEPSAGRTRNVRGVEREKKNHSYSIACFFRSAHLTLTSVRLKDAKQKTE